MPKVQLVRPVRSLATTEARTALPAIVSEMSTVAAGESLLENAIEVGRHRRGEVWIIPAVDGGAAIDREEQLRSRVQELEDELEDVALALMLQERLSESDGATISGEQLIRSLGFAEIADELPTRG